MPKKYFNRIVGIGVHGFKSIGAEQKIIVRGLTVLAGANSSGKSSIIQPLLLLKQTLEASGDPGALLLSGENIKFTRADQLLSKIGGDTFGLGVDLLNGETLGLEFRKTTGGFELAEMIYSYDDYDTEQDKPFKKRRFKAIPFMSHEQILDVLPNRFKEVSMNIGKKPNSHMVWSVRRNRCFFGFELNPANSNITHGGFGGFRFTPAQSFVDCLEDIIHLPGLRGNPSRTYFRTASGPKYQGTFEQYVASVIAEWQNSHNRQKLAALASSLEKMALTWKVTAIPVDDTQVELKVGRLKHPRQGGAKDMVSIADVGFGVSQSLPILVALLSASPGQMVYLEQPEIHLHPLAQRRLASILQEAVVRGVVVVVETHSAILLRELQTLIAAGDLRKEDVAMHWVARNEVGQTTVTTAELDDNGAYGKWPEDFDDTELQAEIAYLDAVEAREVRQ